MAAAHLKQPKPTWQTPDGAIALYQADCREVMPRLAAGSVDSIVTSPPYAMQRKNQYGGIPERDYPAWAVSVLAAARGCLSLRGSALINIRENLKNGEISDYVHRTRLAIRADGWRECEELIWVKPDSPPVGSTSRPRRSWERVLWFSTSGRPLCNTKIGGRASERIGLVATEVGGSSKKWIQGYSESLAAGTSRGRDYFTCGTGENESGIDHPARFPTKLAEWLASIVTPAGGRVCDPFLGSGTTAVACLRLGMKFVGCEIMPNYFDDACSRIEKAWRSMPQLAEVS